MVGFTRTLLYLSPVVAFDPSSGRLWHTARRPSRFPTFAVQRALEGSSSEPRDAMADAPAPTLKDDVPANAPADDCRASPVTVVLSEAQVGALSGMQPTPHETDATADAVVEFLREKDVVLIDIRSNEEVAAFPLEYPAEVASIRKARAPCTLADMSALNHEFLTMSNINANTTPLVVFCKSGKRAGAAVKALEALGCKRVVYGLGNANMAARLREATAAGARVEAEESSDAAGTSAAAPLRSDGALAAVSTKEGRMQGGAALAGPEPDTARAEWGALSPDLRPRSKWSEADFSNTEWEIGVQFFDKDNLDRTWVRFLPLDQATGRLEVEWGWGAPPFYRARGTWEVLDGKSLWFSRDYTGGWGGKRLFNCDLVRWQNEVYLNGLVSGWTPVSPAEVLGQFQCARLGVDRAPYGDPFWTKAWFEAEMKAFFAENEIPEAEEEEGEPFWSGFKDGFLRLADALAPEGTPTGDTIRKALAEDDADKAERRRTSEGHGGDGGKETEPAWTGWLSGAAAVFEATVEPLVAVQRKAIRSFFDKTLGRAQGDFVATTSTDYNTAAKTAEDAAAPAQVDPPEGTPTGDTIRTALAEDDIYKAERGRISKGHGGG